MSTLRVGEFEAQPLIFAFPPADFQASFLLHHICNCIVILLSGGTVLTRNLAVGETIIVDGTSVVGYQDSAKFGIKRAGGNVRSFEPNPKQ